MAAPTTRPVGNYRIAWVYQFNVVDDLGIFVKYHDAFTEVMSYMKFNATVKAALIYSETTQIVIKRTLQGKDRFKT